MKIYTRTKDAVKHAGSKAKLAKLLGITRQAVQSWGPILPEGSAMKLYILSDKKLGKIKNEH